MPQQRLAALAGFCIAFFPLLAATAGETRIVGWRGDGTGKYPAADPPTTWRRVSTTVEGLRFAARPPAGEGQGTAMPDGVIRQWLVLGPVPFAEGAAIEKDTVPGEAELAPDEGRKTADATWKRVSLNTAYLDFATLVGKPGDTVAYACSHVYTPADATFRMNLTYVGGIRVCVNGKAAKPMGTRFKLDLTKGWNRILLKVSHGSSEATGVADWYVVPVLHAWAPAKYQDTNIAWTAPLPAVHPGFYGGGQGVGTPVIVGDRMFVESEPHDLICLRKADGKVRGFGDRVPSRRRAPRRRNSPPSRRPRRLPQRSTRSTRPLSPAPRRASSSTKRRPGSRRTSRRRCGASMPTNTRRASSPTSATRASRRRATGGSSTPGSAAA